MIERKAQVLTGAALLALLATTALLAQLHLGPWNVILAYTISAAKALLVMTFFMELKVTRRFIWIFAASGFFWLAILVVAVWTDVLTRVPIVPR